jgi:hypothetical protein
MLQWYEIIQIAQTLHLDDEDDALIWMWEANGIYSVKSMYAIINFRGVLPVNIHSTWNLKVPPKIHLFMWLMMHNKTLTRDNFVKRQSVEFKRPSVVEFKSSSKDSSLHVADDAQ